jgi:hypothetical protein
VLSVVSSETRSDKMRQGGDKMRQQETAGDKERQGETKPLLSTSKADSGLASEFRRDRAIYTAYERMLKADWVFWGEQATCWTVEAEKSCNCVSSLCDWSDPRVAWGRAPPWTLAWPLPSGLPASIRPPQWPSLRACRSQSWTRATNGAGGIVAGRGRMIWWEGNS